MGTAVVYDQYEDVGLGFSDEQVAAFVPAAWAEGRVKELLHTILVIERYLSLPSPAKEQWWRKVQAKLIDKVTWYCQVAVIPGIDRETVRTLPAATSAEGKALTKAAHGLSESSDSGGAEAWCQSWLSYLAVEMTCFVTLSRRCASAVRISGWKKQDRHLANRVANAIQGEIDLAENMAEVLTSLTK